MKTQESIEKQLKEIAEFFKSKLFEGQFTFEGCDEYRCHVDIYGHKFQLWIANDPKEFFRFYSMDEGVSNPLSPYLKFKTQKERMKGYRQVKPLIQAEKKRLLKEEKQKELKRLRREVENLEKEVDQ